MCVAFFYPFYNTIILQFPFIPSIRIKLVYRIFVAKGIGADAVVLFAEGVWCEPAGEGMSKNLFGQGRCHPLSSLPSLFRPQDTNNLPEL